MYARDDVAITRNWQEPLPGDHTNAAADVFWMLPNRTHLQVLWLLCGDDHDITTAAEAISIVRPAMSHHLAKLRLTGLIPTRRDGHRAVYRARGGHMRRLLNEAIQAVDHHLTGTPDHD